MECGKCMFFKPVMSIGECRRFPPKPDEKGEHSVDDFPIVRKDSWCGEYKKGAKK